jgi:outer membrane protein TolC
VSLPLWIGVLALQLAPPPPDPGSPIAAEAPPPPVGTALRDDYVPPFSSEPLQLSQALREAAKNNYDLAIGDAQVEISEAAVLAALGVYDVFVTAKVEGSKTETPQRGSQWAIDLGRKSVGGSLGVRRALETGGSIEFMFDTARMRYMQPVVLGDATQGSTELTAYVVRPTLTLRHQLLKGAGLKVNRADINKAKIATTAAEAGRLHTAQTVARDLIRAYWELLFAHRDLANKQRSVQQVARQIDATARLVRAGRKSKSDEKSVQQALAAREADVLAAENALLDASLAVRKLMGQKLGAGKTLGLMPATDPVVQSRTIVLDDEIDRAMKANPALKQIELSLASFRIDELVAANKRLPQLEASGTFAPQGRSIDTLGNPMTGQPPTEATWGQAFGNMSDDSGLADWTIAGALTLTWDVQNRGAKGLRQKARAEIEKAQALLEQARQEVTGAVISAANKLRTTAKMIEVAELSRELAEDNLAAEQTRFDLGRATNYDVLLRLDEVDEAAKQSLRAQIDYLEALADLQALTGEILPAYGLAK